MINHYAFKSEEDILFATNLPDRSALLKVYGEMLFDQPLCAETLPLRILVRNNPTIRMRTAG